MQLWYRVMEPTKPKDGRLNLSALKVSSEPWARELDREWTGECFREADKYFLAEVASYAQLFGAHRWREDVVITVGLVLPESGARLKAASVWWDREKCAAQVVINSLSATNQLELDVREAQRIYRTG